MTPDTSIMAKLLHVNGMQIEKVEVQSDQRSDGEPWKYEKVFVYGGRSNGCRGSAQSGYDTKSNEESTWRVPNLNGMLVEVKYQPKRIECREHKVCLNRIGYNIGRLLLRFSIHFLFCRNFHSVHKLHQQYLRLKVGRRDRLRVSFLRLDFGIE